MKQQTKGKGLPVLGSQAIGSLRTKQWTYGARKQWTYGALPEASPNVDTNKLDSGIMELLLDCLETTCADEIAATMNLYR